MTADFFLMEKGKQPQFLKSKAEVAKEDANCLRSCHRHLKYIHNISMTDGLKYNRS